tara:strand:+ start:289 stop:420 length:132 start_codon:yes stop_codon:yes gene_type:complete
MENANAKKSQAKAKSTGRVNNQKRDKWRIDFSCSDKTTLNNLF